MSCCGKKLKPARIIPIPTLTPNPLQPLQPGSVPIPPPAPQPPKRPPFNYIKKTGNWKKTK